MDDEEQEERYSYPKTSQGGKIGPETIQKLSQQYQKNEYTPSH